MSAVTTPSFDERINIRNNLRVKDITKLENPINGPIIRDESVDLLFRED